MTKTNLSPDGPTCTCGRPLEGEIVLVCSGCRRNPVDCRCRGVMHVTGTLPAGRKGGLFAGYGVGLIHDPRADRRAD